MLHGFYSKEAEKALSDKFQPTADGLLEYKTACGSIVKVTAVSNDINFIHVYEWPDVLYMGPVLKFHRKVH